MYFTNHPIISEFNRFVDYINDANELPLTANSANLRAVDLLALDARMLHPEAVTKNKPLAKDFTRLHLFFHIGLTAALWNVRRDAKGNYFLNIQPARISVYDTMSDDERYGFLLQALWCYFDARSAFDDRGISFNMSNLLRRIHTFEIGRPTVLNSYKSGEYKHIIIMLSALGLIEYTTGPARLSSYLLDVNTITVTATGKKLLPILGSDDLLMNWRDLDPTMTPQRWAKCYKMPEKEEALPPELSDFFAQFKTAYPAWQVNTRLFPIVYETVEGVYTLKIALDTKCYRIIEMHSAMSLDHLHEAIQTIFNFDNDHLYAFFLNGQSEFRPGNVFADPRGSLDTIEYPANLFTLGELGLFPGQSVLYIFDFGDNWSFYIDILKLVENSDKPAQKYALIHSVGKAPEQYPDFD